MHGFVLDQDHPSVDFTMSGYTLHVSLDEIFGNHADNGFGLIMATGPDEFLGAGKGFRVTFTPRAGCSVGIARWTKAASKTANGSPAAASMGTRIARAAPGASAPSG